MRWGPSLITGFVLLAVSASLASAAGEPAAARACFASAEARDAIAQNHLINSTIAMRNAAIKLQGEALAGKLCRWTEQFVYEITLLRRDGRVIHAFIDARTGEVVGAQNNN